MITTKMVSDYTQEKEIGKSGNTTFVGVTISDEQALNELISDYEEMIQEKVSENDMQELRISSFVDLRVYYKDDVAIDADIFDPYRHLEMTRGQYIQPSGWTYRFNEDFISVDEDSI